jgi:hypothetical protein
MQIVTRLSRMFPGPQFDIQGGIRSQRRIEVPVPVSESAR